MIDRLRALANRPIRPEERTRAIVIAAVLVVVALVGLLALERPTRPSAEPAATAPVAPPAATPPEAADHPVPTRGELRSARQTAKRFLKGYLAYSYGRGTAADIEGVGPNLRRELAARPPRVPGTVARLRPRVMTIQLEAEETENVEATGLVRDGERAYSIVFELDQTADGWQVSGLGG